MQVICANRIFLAKFNGKESKDTSILHIHISHHILQYLSIDKFHLFVSLAYFSLYQRQK